MFIPFGSTFQSPKGHHESTKMTGLKKKNIQTAQKTVPNRTLGSQTISAYRTGSITILPRHRNHQMDVWYVVMFFKQEQNLARVL